MRPREFVAGLASTLAGSPIVVALAACLCVPSPWSVAYSLAQGIAPRYEVDVTFPQPFLDLWVTGGFGGHCIDAQDRKIGRKGVFDTSDGTIKGTPLNSNASRFTSPASISGRSEERRYLHRRRREPRWQQPHPGARCERQFPAPVADHRHGLGALHGVRQ